LIPFDSEGTCILCKTAEFARNSDSVKTFDEKDLLDRIEQIRERASGKPYDCVVGVSGGRDSTYLLYLLTQKHHLRCLAVYYRTPFTSNLIDANVRRIVKELGADFEEIQLSQDYHKRIARKMVLLWKKKQHRLIINLACAPCKLLNREIYKIAHSHGIPTIVIGVNIYEAVQIAPGVSKKQVLLGKSTQVHNILNKFRNMLSIILNGTKLLATSPAILKYLILAIKSSVMYISPLTFYLAFRYPKIQIFDYFYGGQWNESDCENVLKDLGWERPPGCYSSWKADCCFAEMKNILFQKTIGISYADAFFSNMVRAGIISREEALERLQTEGRVSEVRLKEAKKILELEQGLF
jgi:hypothetical protein